MKAVWVVGAVIVAAGVGYFLYPWGAAVVPMPAPAPEPTLRLDPPTSVNADPTGVFQKAFWRNPSDADEILHAERNEWADAGGVQKWQWFLVVKPSPGLVNYLWTDNAFGLVSKTTAGRPGSAPAWFAPPAAGVDILGTPAEGLQLILDRKENVLYACDSGKGFQPGAAEPERISPPSVPPGPAGRLPSTPPPDPAKEK